jgi:hypothetical protein
MPEPRPSDHNHRRREPSLLLRIEQALAGLPADQLQDFSRAEQISGVDALVLGPARHGRIIPESPGTSDDP